MRTSPRCFPSGPPRPRQRRVAEGYHKNINPQGLSSPFHPYEVSRNQQHLLFRADRDGRHFTSPPGRTETLEYAQGYYTLTAGDGTRTVFDSPAGLSLSLARLDRIELGDGLAVSATYWDLPPPSPDCTPSDYDPSHPEITRRGSLCKVSTTTGRSLYFQWGHEYSQTIADIAAPDGDTPILRYRYLEACGASWTTCDGASLCCTQQPNDGPVVQKYSYLPHERTRRGDDAGPYHRLFQIETGSGAILEKHRWTHEYTIDLTETREEKLCLSRSMEAGTGTTSVSDAYAGTTTEPRRWTLEYTDGRIDRATGDCGCTTQSHTYATGPGSVLTSTTDKLGNIRSVSHDSLG